MGGERVGRGYLLKIIGSNMSSCVSSLTSPGWLLEVASHVSSISPGWLTLQDPPCSLSFLPLYTVGTGRVLLIHQICVHSSYWESAPHSPNLCTPITKPPLLQESGLTGGGSSIGCVLVECKVPAECELGAAINFHSLHP